jgi:hypothetical protein
MSYSLPDPTEIKIIEPGPPDVPPSGEVGEILAEMKAGSEAAAIQAEIDELRQPILQAAQEEEDQSREAVEGTDEYRAISMSAQGLKAAWQEFSKREKATVNNPDLSLDGREKAIQRDAVERDARIQTIATLYLSDQADRLLARFPEVSLPGPSSEQSGEAGLLFASFGITSPVTHIWTEIGRLRRAADRSTPNGEKVRANVIMHHAGLPTVQRRATNPEPFSRPLQRQFINLAELQESHLDTVLQKSRHDFAVEYVALARQNFTWLHNMARHHNGWDDFAFRIGVSAFVWGDEKEPTAQPPMIDASLPKVRN